MSAPPPAARRRPPSTRPELLTTRTPSPLPQPKTQRITEEMTDLTPSDYPYTWIYCLMIAFRNIGFYIILK